LAILATFSAQILLLRRASSDSGRDRSARGEAQGKVDSRGDSIVNTIVGGMSNFIALEDVLGYLANA
jgi:hypothetical protein